MATSQSTLQAPVQASAPLRESWRNCAIVIGTLALVRFVLYLLFSGRYDYFRDELYYIACSEHLSWGYVDQPPMIALAVRLERLLFGDSLVALRFFAALAGIAVIALTVLIAREMGGRKFALWLSGICVLTGPIWLSLGYLMTMNAFEHVWWAACAYCVVRYINTRNPRYWLWFGLWAGLGLETKYSITVFGLGIVVGLLLTRERKTLLKPTIWIAGAIALLIFLPNLLWNIHYHWPFVELMHNIHASGRDVVLSPLQFLAQQVLLTGPIALPVWIAGLVWLFFSPTGSRFRALGWAYLVVLIVFMVMHGKNYYPAPAYPMLFAAGGVALESALARFRRPVIGWVYIGAILAAGAWISPMLIPVLPIHRYLSYQEHWLFKPPASEHSHMRSPLPQTYSDQFGWEEIVEATAHAYRELTPNEQKDCAIFAQDYGAAGAIDFFGQRYGLPKALSGHQSYFLWGPRNYTGQCMIVLDDRRERLQELFDRVEYITTSAPHPYALEQQLPVYICHGAKFGSLQELWPKIKKWD
ncbi:MAG: ArnT family glycosyltransferase [Terriglobales bacterium]